MRFLLPGLREDHASACSAFNVIARGWAGPSLLAMIAFEKFGQHQPLNRQAERYALEGAPIALSTMADADRLRVRGARADPSPGGGPCDGGRAAAWRRYDRARTGPG